MVTHRHQQPQTGVTGTLEMLARACGPPTDATPLTAADDHDSLAGQPLALSNVTS
jgi:hypothetical protein